MNMFATNGKLTIQFSMSCFGNRNETKGWTAPRGVAIMIVHITMASTGAHNKQEFIFASLHDTEAPSDSVI